jgi:hypothetical protein
LGLLANKDCARHTSAGLVYPSFGNFSWQQVDGAPLHQARWPMHLLLSLQQLSWCCELCKCTEGPVGCHSCRSCLLRALKVHLHHYHQLDAATGARPTLESTHVDHTTLKAAATTSNSNNKSSQLVALPVSVIERLQRHMLAQGVCASCTNDTHHSTNGPPHISTTANHQPHHTPQQVFTKPHADQTQPSLPKCCAGVTTGPRRKCLEQVQTIQQQQEHWCHSCSFFLDGGPVLPPTAAAGPAAAAAAALALLTSSSSLRGTHMPPSAGRW